MKSMAASSGVNQKIRARHELDGLLERRDGPGNRVRRVEWRETPCKQAGHGLGAGESADHAFRPLTQDEDAAQRHGPLRDERLISVPRRAVHEHASATRSQDDAVVAEHCRAGLAAPQSRQRALACARKSEEQQPVIAVGDAAAVQLDAVPPREQVREDQLVEGIFQRIDVRRRRKERPVEDDFARLKNRDENGRLCTEPRRIRGEWNSNTSSSAERLNFHTPPESKATGHAVPLDRIARASMRASGVAVADEGHACSGEYQA